MDKERAKELMFDEGEDGEGFKDSIVVVELELIEEDAGVIRGELIIEGEVDTTGSLLVPLNQPKPENWQDLEVGETKAYALRIDSRKETLREKMSAFFSRSLEEGRVQDFVPGTPPGT
ncbi:hypothetical protein J2754_000764 [Halarchaeum solikamskense]|uniref:hypothetical protein n=1 Tax=Halarchaeum nitratireducens TaxID=489913 RepID=UPI001B3B1897|nr:hypothetical protein [Halarchaeum solikamskense]MBP2250455.1 hypothetical protein [Halarchaeum solikamskense]